MAHTKLDWLTTEVLSESLGEEVKEFSVAAAAPPGNNYGSVVTRVSVTLKGRADPLSLIVKSELTEGSMKDAIDVPETIEHDFYYKFLPEARKITDISFAPEAFPIMRAKSVVLEDLKSVGFEMADRCKQLDFEHCRLYMIAAAKFHAVSFVMNKRNPDLIKRFEQEKLYADNLKSAISFKMMIESGVPNFLKAANKLGKFQRGIKIIEKVQDSMWDMIVNSHKKRKGINTLNQSDPWTTNMMFRYDENRIVRDIKLLDFQCLRFGSPVNDIVMFLWSSADHDVKASRIPDLYKIYLENFNENLKDFGCSEEFTEEDFKDKIRKMSPMVLFIVIAFVPVIVGAIELDYNKLYTDKINYFGRFYDEHYCSYHVPKFMEEMEKAGVFDYLDQTSNN